MDLSRFDPYFERQRLVVVNVLIEGDETQPAYVGAGVLVTLGDREFVLTAGHNVWLKERARLADIAVTRQPDRIVVFVRPGDGSAGRVFCPPPGRPGGDPEPDVAVVEPTDRTLLSLGRQPFTEDEIAFFDTNLVTLIGEKQATGMELVASGYPVQELAYSSGRPVGAPAGTQGDLATPLVSTRACSLPDAWRPDRFPNEPAEGRGLHFLLATRQEDAEGNVTQLRCAEGFSGGPVVSPEGTGGVLVGLMRGVLDFEGGWDMWCEPAAEAVRLLVDHEDARVAAAARRVCERYDEARAKAPKRVTIVPRVA